MRIGCHLSASKGFPAAAKAAVDVGANTFQFFTRNPRGGAARNIGADEVASWVKLREEKDIFPAVGHFPYTVNMASPVERAYNFALMTVGEDLVRMDKAGAEFLVVHPGSHAGSGKEEGLKRIISCLEKTLLPFSGSTVLLLETMAGQGSEIGGLDDIAEMMSALGCPENLGVCLDSCHLTAMGYDFRQKEEADRLADDLSRTVGLEKVKIMHLNDSKFPPGTHKDRHELMGKGYLGKEGIVNLITHPFFRRLPMLLETPVNDYRQYAEEIAMLRSWLEEARL